MIETLHPEVQDSLLACCSVKAFDADQFDSLLAEYGLNGSKATLTTEVYDAVVAADCERRRQARKMNRSRRRDGPSLN
jgi:hypothetical protein